MAFESANLKTDKIEALSQLSFGGIHLHTSQFTEFVSSTITLDAADSGKALLIDTDAFTITLPATVIGYNYTFVNFGADGTILITISPNSSDYIAGCDITAATNKDLLNTKTTAKFGDYVRLVADGSAGWFIADLRGTWVRES